MQATQHTANYCGKIIVLLGPRGAGKTAALMSVFGWYPSSIYAHIAPFLPNRLEGISICSKQGLLQSHLTGRENMVWMAALYGLPGQARVDELLNQSDFGDHADAARAYTLPRPLRRKLQLLIAFLPDPDLLLIDDLTEGLSVPAKRDLWRFLLVEQARRPSNILYATRDLEAARFLGNEIWLIADGDVQRKWPIHELPEAFRASAGYALDLRNRYTAQKFLRDATMLKSVYSCRFQPPHTVEVMVDDGDKIVDLTWMAGLDLAGFRSLPLLVDYLVPIPSKDSNGTGSEESGSISVEQANESLPRPGLPEGPDHTQEARVPEFVGRELRNGKLTSSQKGEAILQIALSEWRRHFRSFWKAGNLLFSGLYLLIVLQAITPGFIGLDVFLHLAPIFLLFSATMVLGLGTEALSRLATTGEADTLFHSARPVSGSRPLSQLALLDLTPIGRGGLLVGLALGQFLILIAHAWPLTLFAWGIWNSFPQARVLSGASVLFWSLSALTSLALATLLSALIRRPGWGRWIGWASWPLALASSQLPTTWEPYAWFWPLAGYAAAFERLFALPRALLPLGMGLSGSILLCLLAVRAFRNRSAVWSPRS